MIEPFISIVDRLRSFNGRPTYEVPFLGNSGDELIRMVMRNLMRAAGVSIVNAPENADILVWPGGNFCMWLPHLRLFETLIRGNPEAKIMMGPGTYQKSILDWESLFNRYADRIDSVYARDRASYDHLKTTFPNGPFDIELCPDLAIGLRDDPLITTYVEGDLGGYRLVAIRNDHESKVADGWSHRLLSRMPGAGIRFYSCYLLARLMAGFKSREIHAQVGQYEDGSLENRVVDVSLSDLDEFLSVIGRANEVHTDRLHVMLAALMMRKKTYAYQTRFGKLEDAWDMCKEYVGSDCDVVSWI